MHGQYSKVPQELALSEIIDNGSSLSPAHFRRVQLPNKNFEQLRDLIRKPIRGKDQEASDFIEASPYYYLKTKALKDNQLLIETEENGCLEYLRPSAFFASSNAVRKLAYGDLLYCSSGGEEIGEAALVTDLGPQIIFSSHSFKIEVKDQSLKLYLLSVLKSQFCKEQLSFLVYKGATLRRGGDKFLGLRIPFPNHQQAEVIRYLSVLTEVAINKEQAIKRRHKSILEQIETELTENQLSNHFSYEFPSLKEIRAANRIDTNLFGRFFRAKEFLIKNYVFGFSSIESLGFAISRGQNLQLSAIGASIYSDANYPNFYTLMLPKHLSRYGTVEKVEYIGNKNKLKTVNKGDVIFGAEGFEKGRSIVITEDFDRTVTNIHGITLHHMNGDMILSVFIKCFLDFLRTLGLIDLYAVGGNGGSLAMRYWDIIPFPNFPREKMSQIAKLYHNPDVRPNSSALNMDNFLEVNRLFDESAGVLELDRTARNIKAQINSTIDLIVRDQPIPFVFDLFGRQLK